MQTQDPLINTLQNFTVNVNGVLKQEKDTSEFNNYEKYQVEYTHNGSDIVLIVYLQLIPERGRGPYTTRYTKSEIKIRKRNEINVKLVKATGFSKFAALFSSSRIKTGNDEFDKRFLLFSKDAQLVKGIFLQPNIFQPLLAFNDLYLTINRQTTVSNPILESDQLILQININYAIVDENGFLKLSKLTTDIADTITSGRPYAG